MTATLRPRNTPTLPLPVVRPDPCIQTIPLRPEDLDEVREADVATRQVDREELARRLGSPADLPRAPSPPPIPPAPSALLPPLPAPTPPALNALPPPLPAPTPRPVRASVWRSRKLVVAAVLGLALVAVATALLASKSDRPAAPAAVEQRPSPPPPVVAPDPIDDLVARAKMLIASGDREGALDLVLRSRVTYSQDARLATLAGRLYFEKLWWADGIKQLRAAFALDPSLRSDPEIVALAVNGYVTTPAYNAILGRFVREDIGAAALPALEQIARTHRSRTLRSRAAAELRRMASH